MLYGKHILVIISGGVAAYKAIELIRLIQKAGGTVQAILTKSATEFVSPLTISTLCGRPALTALFDLTRETEIGHIELSRSADLIVIAPGTANILAKLANGIADDLATTCLLATDTPIMAAPAMNVRMWEAASTRRNLALLANDGVQFVGPDEGEMACGEFGPGRLAEPPVILEAIVAHFERANRPKPLAGKHAIVTSGPTREPIDPVRFLSNASSGKQGVAIAEALAALGARVSFVTGPAQYRQPRGCAVIDVETAIEMDRAVEAALPADIAVFCAAVSDWRVETPADDKIKKDADETAPTLTLVANPDILRRVSSLAGGNRPRLVVGFAAETSNLLENAKAKLKRKGCDWLLANDVSPASGTFGGANNTVTLLAGEAVEAWEPMDKQAVAQKLATRIAESFQRDRRI
ncbi:bifunctional phosphopantothenoylcysteine decarboxylase/phosphopantothenate--cysteine ligase CoaBC [Pelagibacterium lentulum]|uniref:Coenzyme A biosynthesis bifunctional protein CoaBC n=1 Tax=Pelagibacterium lentulum TaxID=2029865 RepID=A0A916VV17_9HYPH|nr:bifunctional phosphopantothenoylcysteine decarboxylase/phosphopantothenate--cysteine ligase CoaBC [Pelagibacterium lentulum]GGA38037.1 phosphopantothenate synthase [Pelagibacterium lentulum]